MKLLLPLIFLLMVVGMTNCSSIVRTVYIERELQYIPEKPHYYGVTFHDDGTSIEKGYCLDENNAKNLLKNRILDLGYMEELRGILEELKGVED